MSKTAHTPGPWVAAKYEGFGPRTTVRQGDERTGMRIASTFETTSPKHIERNEANARLIAAAPDLLAALLDCAHVMERELNGLAVIQPELRQARAAINKAIGEKQ